MPPYPVLIPSPRAPGNQAAPRLILEQFEARIEAARGLHPPELLGAPPYLGHGRLPFSLSVGAILGLLLSLLSLGGLALAGLAWELPEALSLVPFALGVGALLLAGLAAGLVLPAMRRWRSLVTEGRGVPAAIVAIHPRYQDPENELLAPCLAVASFAPELAQAPERLVHLADELAGLAREGDATDPFVRELRERSEALERDHGRLQVPEAIAGDADTWLLKLDYNPPGLPEACPDTRLLMVLAHPTRRGAQDAVIPFGPCWPEAAAELAARFPLPVEDPGRRPLPAAPGRGSAASGPEEAPPGKEEAFPARETAAPRPRLTAAAPPPASGPDLRAERILLELDRRREGLGLRGFPDADEVEPNPWRLPFELGLNGVFLFLLLLLVAAALPFPANLGVVAALGLVAVWATRRFLRSPWAGSRRQLYQHGVVTRGAMVMANGGYFEADAEGPFPGVVVFGLEPPFAGNAAALDELGNRLMELKHADRRAMPPELADLAWRLRHELAGGPRVPIPASFAGAEGVYLADVVFSHEHHPDEEGCFAVLTHPEDDRVTATMLVPQPVVDAGSA